MGNGTDETAGGRAVFLCRLGTQAGSGRGEGSSGTVLGRADVRQTILVSFVLILTGGCDL